MKNELEIRRENTKRDIFCAKFFLFKIRKKNKVACVRVCLCVF